MDFEHVYLLFGNQKSPPQTQRMSSRWAVFRAAQCMWKVGCADTYPHSPGAQAVPYRVIDTRGKYSIVFVPPCSLMVFLPPLHNQLSNEQGENSCKPFRMNRFRRLDYSRSSKRFAGNKWSLFGCADKTQDIFPFQVYNTARLQYSKSP
jgi:hypothetical protein